ncbi:hypothetical protein GQ457_10G027450 [Hibiscus cannabinus]
MEPQNFGHQHPLLFNEEESNPSELGHCSKCGEVMSGPSFSCAEPECEFYLHKECAEVPLQITHPFHRDHPLLLLSNPPTDQGYDGGFWCTFCGERGEMFVYHCSCNIDLHIKCAFFTFNFAERNFPHLQDVAYKDPSISTQNSNKELESSKCFACWEPLFDSAYYSLDCGFNLHKKCVELSSEINYPLHYQHPLRLQFSVENLPCNICYNIHRFGLSYYCSLCNFTIHIACLSPPPTVQGKVHQHTFTLFFRQIPFTCDACGVQGNSVPYLCLNCNLLVHKKCISFPPIIKFLWHEHPLFHSFFIRIDDSKSQNWDCVVCLDEVNTKHGSYYCSECHFILHVTCAIADEKAYSEIESIDKFNESRVLSEDSYIVIERNEGGKVIKIKHFTHEHNLVLCDKAVFSNVTIASTLAMALPINATDVGSIVASDVQLLTLLHVKDMNILLPTKVRDKCDKHLLPLTYKDDSAYSESHFCDICEKARNPNHWFYHCEKCDTSAYFGCVLGLGNYSRIKSGKIYKEGKHSHPLRCGEMEPPNFGHQHPLLFNEEESNPSEADHCSRCGEVMSGPSSQKVIFDICEES